MNTAIILAGGMGTRIGTRTPKQFLEINDVPIIVYTLSVFQKHKDIDKIVVVCLKDWEKKILKFKTEYNITKLERVISGGKNSMESISNGISGIADMMNRDDIVVIHDSVRPLISFDIITDCLKICKKYGNGCAMIDLQETIVKTKDHISGNININRSDVKRVQTPQAYNYGLVNDLYNEAHQLGITESIYTNTLLLELGGTIYFSKGSEMNLKITTPKDLDIFRILLEFRSEIPEKKQSD